MQTITPVKIRFAIDNLIADENGAKTDGSLKANLRDILALH
jgi:hypothetical protein